MLRHPGPCHDGDMPGDVFDTAVEELYALPPDEFTAARNERARAAKPKDRDAAARIQELRRPSAAAWLVNQLVRHRPDELDAILDLGADARESQGRFDGAELAQLSRQRRRLVSALAREAGALADELGTPVRAPVLDEVAQTLQAGMSDASAADAVRSGRLVRSLEAVGLEVDLDGAVAGGPPAGGAAAGGRRSAPASKQKPDSDESAERAAAREREQHEERKRAADDAEQRAVEASDALDELERSIADRHRTIDEGTARRDELEAELRTIEEEISDAQRELRGLTRDRDRAARAATLARDEADDARAALD